MNDWHNIYITDKTGEKFFNTDASPMSVVSEIKNVMRHLNNTTEGKTGYQFIDPDTAVLVVDGEPWLSVDEILDDDLLNELMS